MVPDWLTPENGATLGATIGALVGAIWLALRGGKKGHPTPHAVQAAEVMRCTVPDAVAKLEAKFDALAEDVEDIRDAVLRVDERTRKL